MDKIEMETFDRMRSAMRHAHSLIACFVFAGIMLGSILGGAVPAIGAATGCVLGAVVGFLVMDWWAIGKINRIERTYLHQQKNAAPQADVNAAMAALLKKIEDRSKEDKE